MRVSIESAASCSAQTPTNSLSSITRQALNEFPVTSSLDPSENNFIGNILLKLAHALDKTCNPEIAKNILAPMFSSLNAKLPQEDSLHKTALAFINHTLTTLSWVKCTGYQKIVAILTCARIALLSEDTRFPYEHTDTARSQSCFLTSSLHLPPPKYPKRAGTHQPFDSPPSPVYEDETESSAPGEEIQILKAIAATMKVSIDPLPDTIMETRGELERAKTKHDEAQTKQTKKETLHTETHNSWHIAHLAYYARCSGIRTTDVFVSVRKTLLDARATNQTARRAASHARKRANKWKNHLEAAECEYNRQYTEHIESVLVSYIEKNINCFRLHFSGNCLADTYTSTFLELIEQAEKSIDKKRPERIKLRDANNKKEAERAILLNTVKGAIALHKRDTRAKAAQARAANSRPLSEKVDIVEQEPQPTTSQGITP
ncbi:MAG TPA: hypothetical protein EYO58_07450, partial [Flavobacteriales bacterium]|nr:hypothetical protein [Flavobacteriales bacterium]